MPSLSLNVRWRRGIHHEARRNHRPSLAEPYIFVCVAAKPVFKLLEGLINWQSGNHHASGGAFRRARVHLISVNLYCEYLQAAAIAAETPGQYQIIEQRRK